MATLTQRLANPTRFMELSGRLLPWIAGAACVLLAAGLYMAATAPLDYQQGHAAKIMFVHVPAAWLSMFGYALVAISSFGLLVFRHPLADVSAKAAAPIGATFTALCLLTGMLWGKPMWGTWWTWDARLTSELVLLFLYLGVIGLYHAFEDRRQGARAAGFLAIIGIVNVPIVHFSVNWWNTLHQGSTINVFRASTIASDMLWPLLVLTLATKAWYVASLFRRTRVGLLTLERGKDWVRTLAAEATP